MRASTEPRSTSLSAPQSPGGRVPALLVLEDGATFTGSAFGAVGETFGEAVFTTGMSGYQETLTDPSYHRQVVVATAPHIGNTGWNDEDDESSRIWVAGYVVRDAARVPSSWRSRRSLDDALAAQGVVGMCDVDTRALTRHLRERGAMRAGISSTTTGSPSTHPCPAAPGRRTGGRGSATSGSTTTWSRASHWRTTTVRCCPSRCSTTPRPPPAPTTRRTSSTASPD